MTRNRFSAVLTLVAPAMASRKRFVATFLIPISLVAVCVAIIAQPGQAGPIQPGDADYEYLFDEGTGTTVADTGAAGAGKDASFTGSPAWSTETPFSYAGNNSLSNNGSGAATVDGFNVDMGTQSTISMWVRYDAQSPGGTQYIHDTNGGTGRFLWYYSSGGDPASIYWDSQNKTNASLSTLVDDQWTHKAVVRDGTELRVYEAGALIRTDTVGATATTFGDLRLGARISNNEFFRGEIDEYAYWTSALSGDNIEWLSQNSLTGAGGGGPEPPTTTNLALGKEYAFYLHLPGQSPGTGPHYLDDGHAGTLALGVFDSGKLADGIVSSSGADGSVGTQYVGFYGTPGNLPAAEIVFDLGDEFAIEDIVIGTGSRACCGTGSPDDVDISFSTTSATDGFGPATNFALWGQGSLPAGHQEMTLAASSPLARYVKLSFDGGDHGGGIEKYMLDEISINGSAPSAAVPEPSTFALAAVGLLGLGIFGRRRRKRVA